MTVFETDLILISIDFTILSLRFLLSFSFDWEDLAVSTKAVPQVWQAYATMPIGIMGSKR